MHRSHGFIVLAVALITALLVCPVSAQQPRPGFFITSATSGTGDLGGLAGADKTCQTLAQGIAGAGNRVWRAYLSTNGPGGVNARDRIGNGPWYNVKGVLIAQNVADLHSDTANVNNDTSLDEKGTVINPAGGANRHDILTGSNVEGRAVEQTCSNWTSSAAGSAMLGHHDRLSRGTPGSPWNSAHPSQGCSAPQMVATGGAGLLYCFAAD